MNPAGSGASFPSWLLAARVAAAGDMARSAAERIRAMSASTVSSGARSCSGRARESVMERTAVTMAGPLTSNGWWDVRFQRRCAACFLAVVEVRLDHFFDQVLKATLIRPVELRAGFCAV